MPDLFWDFYLILPLHFSGLGIEGNFVGGGASQGRNRNHPHRIEVATVTGIALNLF